MTMDCWPRKILAAAVCAVALLFAAPAQAEDIDLFANVTPTSAASRPNILIVIDNSANWSAANQHWPGGLKQGQAELKALRTLLLEVTDNVNIGLMMFSAGAPNGGYIRFHMRQMTAVNRAALREL